MSDTDLPMDPTTYDARELSEAALGFLRKVTAAAGLEPKDLAFRVGWTPERYEAWEKNFDHASMMEFHTFLIIAVTANVRQRLATREGRESGGDELIPSLSLGIPYEPQGSPAQENGGARQAPTELIPGLWRGVPYEGNSAGFVAETGSTPADLIAQVLRFFDLYFMGWAGLARVDPTLAPPLVRRLGQWARWFDEASIPMAQAKETPDQVS